MVQIWAEIHACRNVQFGGEKLLRTIGRTIFSGPLGPRFLVAGQFFDELHRALLWEIREISPHDFGAFLLAEEAACSSKAGEFTALASSS